MKKLFILFVLSIMAITISAQSNADEAYVAKVKELTELTSVKQVLATNLGYTYANMAPQLGLSQAKARELGVVMCEAIYDRYMAMCVPIYKKYFTIEDLAAACKFYASPEGAKWGKYSANISLEAAQEVNKLLPEVMPVVEKFIQENRGK